ncbi:aconitate hydratase [Legionella israelensis]|uniref:Aconitate hydratase n=1 Tax=Legionella israelensis TaxID=454 RepID=A0A0W0WNZ8_9GAMM|nr:aconitate hydratase [Legionella israelensis]KTD34039.1 aconitate hydratase [Legionella israelensis]QBS10628.1 aconitate hydratase [Legionella israelensis]SCX85077.1 aconitase [Legionella israelensis DSM 19235]STX57580.1 aconitate hydratase [Legionella israelensis]
MNVSEKIIKAHLMEGEMVPGKEIGLKIDQTLCQDATGTLVMLELEAMELDRTKAELSVQYVDHNLIQEDNKNPDDHLFLESSARRFGLYYSRPGNGISHVVHMQNFGKPGKTLTGSDSHTPAAGSLGMLALGSGGLEVATAIAGYPLYIKMPKILGVNLIGQLPDWVCAKDVILEMLRRYDVKGCSGYIIEYYGEGLQYLSAMDRHVIANMGTEVGATTTVFPSDDKVYEYLKSQGRERDWVELKADKDATYDKYEEIDLSKLEPLIAKPSSPGNVVRVAEIAGEEIYQTYIGSSANPGYRDYAIAAEMVKGRTVQSHVSFDINPSSRTILEELVRDSHLGSLIHAGARIHQAGCNGCIGMGQAPATDKISLRTVPRNFPGRSGTSEDKVYLCSPETAAASALKGVITDPRTLDMKYPKVKIPDKRVINPDCIDKPLPFVEAQNVQLIKGPNIVSLPEYEAMPDHLHLPVLLKVGDNISTDEISPAGAKVLPYRSNIPKISEFTYRPVDKDYVSRTKKAKNGHAIVGGENYGQGSSREHAALAPRELGLRAVLAKSFARIHWQNLINFGIIPLVFKNPKDYDEIQLNDLIKLDDLEEKLHEDEFTIIIADSEIRVTQSLSERQREVLALGGLINWIKKDLENKKG